MIYCFQEHRLSPALSSIPNGGEGVAAGAIHIDRIFENSNARPIPSPRSAAGGVRERGGVAGMRMMPNPQFVPPNQDQIIPEKGNTK